LYLRQGIGSVFALAQSGTAGRMGVKILRSLQVATNFAT